MIYLDHAAATPLDPAVLAAMQPYFSQQFYNPSAIYQAAVAVRQAVEAARSSVAAVLGARPAEVVFTAGGSEANNLALSGVMARYPGAKLALSAIEHDSVLETAKQYNHRLLAVNADGILELPARLDDDTVLVSVMYANNEIGSIQPIRQLGQEVAATRRDRQQRGIKLPLYLHVDAAQAANYLDLQVSRLGADLLSLNGGKIYGPKQSGALYIHGGLQLEPMLRGGGQERGLRSGTENVPGIIGFAEALVSAQARRHQEARRLAGLQAYFFKRLGEVLPGAVVSGSQKRRLPNNLHFQLPGQDNERLLFALDSAGIMAAAGSACSAADETASHVLAALGLDEAAARSSLRLTMGRTTSQADLDRALAVLAELCRQS